MERWVEIIHVLPGRIRLRVAALRNQREETAAAARAVAALPGVVEIRVRPFTGSFLVSFERSKVDGDAIALALRDATGARAVLPRGERPPVPRATAGAPISKVGQALVQAFRDANEDLLRRTDGGLDLGVLATAAFFGFGAAEVVATRKLAAPPWFNVAWWGFQTFLSAEGTPGANGAAAEPSRGDGGASGTTD